MKIFLTGHKGIIGQEFIKRYSDDYEIVGYDLQDGDDLLDYENLLNKISGCEQVVHLAAISKPVEGKSFEDYFHSNVEATLNILKAAVEKKVKRVVYASSTTIYGIEKGIPFKTPITENQSFISQYLTAQDLSCRDVDLSYHMSKVMAEQALAWYGLNKKIETTALRFAPTGKVFLGTSVSFDNATQAIKLALDYSGKLWYEPFSITDELNHIDISKAKKILGYRPEKPNYPPNKIHSSFEERTK
ncbi:MAG: NAD(P)-dependent oxidoreductase [Candidatus Pacebacteria bacterium]|jgi:nucleoside-diphosphate-sugar epimerase|nr:NAD(P)-dependent oxidoreductase [Candidatus Paceibacterota bacterium]MBT3512182.1 NAD(P)-dependent oxidoreductase [Candidatus Paceibacterota bacterium]MBT4004909.1 NAD(P)-dependent oxidoreductase [Candidatus Paceibacterota bacterium]MBT4358649.1 NAD(P)-dependent oxidoreductase [Candidatus Paceibacterota bacterium]MBT4681356.1 NAD(P)-dependent oxidoreductase [Candidatus Paceibacterota bacterium]